jgi:hypothetical protein
MKKKNSISKTNIFGLPRNYPSHARKDFKDAEWMLKIVHDLALLHNELKRLGDSSAASFIDREKINYCFSVICREIVANTPFKPCKACLPEEENCKYCHGKRWITAMVHDPEVIAERMASFPLGSKPK